MKNNSYLNPSNLDETLFNKFIKWQAIILSVCIALFCLCNDKLSDKYLDTVDYNPTEWRSKPGAKISYQLYSLNEKKSIGGGVQLKPLAIYPQFSEAMVLVELPDGQRGLIDPTMVSQPNAVMETLRSLHLHNDSFITIDGSSDSDMIGKTVAQVESKLGDAQVVEYLSDGAVKRYYHQAKVLDIGTIYYGSWIVYRDDKVSELKPNERHLHNTWITKLPHLKNIASKISPKWGSLYFEKSYDLDIPVTWWINVLGAIVFIILFVVYMFTIHVLVLYCISNIIFATMMICFKELKRDIIILIGLIFYLPIAYICANVTIWIMQPVWLISTIVVAVSIIGLVHASRDFLTKNRCDKCLKYFDVELLNKDMVDFSSNSTATIYESDDRSIVTTNTSYKVVRHYKCRECDHHWTFVSYHSYSDTKKYSGAYGYQDEWSSKN